jgi:hypothetical protein
MEDFLDIPFYKDLKFVSFDLEKNVLKHTRSRTNKNHRGHVRTKRFVHEN